MVFSLQKTINAWKFPEEWINPTNYQSTMKNILDFYLMNIVVYQLNPFVKILFILSMKSHRTADPVTNRKFDNRKLLPDKQLKLFKVLVIWHSKHCVQENVTGRREIVSCNSCTRNLPLFTFWGCENNKTNH